MKGDKKGGASCYCSTGIQYNVSMKSALLNIQVVMVNDTLWKVALENEVSKINIISIK